MTLTASAVRPADALAELGRAIAAAKGDDPLASVTVVVPTNTCGVMARRALGRTRGIVGVDMVTLNRLAELIAGPTLAESGRSPMSSSLVELAIAQVLDAHPGTFRDVATHPTTIVALRRVHDEIRLVGPDAAVRLAASSRRAQEAVRISRAVTAQLEGAWYDAIAAETRGGKPLLGICLGMQWLFEGSDEAPDVKGLGVMTGRITRLQGDAGRRLKIPHVGWNALEFKKPARLLEGLATGAQVYFTHSYAAPVTDDTVAATTHRDAFASVVERDLVFGVQFHPEKSSDAGLQMIRNFLGACGR